MLAPGQDCRKDFALGTEIAIELGVERVPAESIVRHGFKQAFVRNEKHLRVRDRWIRIRERRRSPRDRGSADMTRSPAPGFKILGMQEFKARWTAKAAGRRPRKVVGRAQDLRLGSSKVRRPFRGSLRFECTRQKAKGGHESKPLHAFASCKFRAHFSPPKRDFGHRIDKLRSSRTQNLRADLPSVV